MKTPRTDAFDNLGFCEQQVSWADFARQLERELAAATEYADETHARHQSLVEQIAQLKQANAALSEELREQAVANGIGGSREAKLLAELDKLRSENAALREDKQRLDWLLEATNYFVVRDVIAGSIDRWTIDNTRAAIDAARKEAQP